MSPSHKKLYFGAFLILLLIGVAVLWAATPKKADLLLPSAQQFPLQNPNLEISWEGYSFQKPVIGFLYYPTWTIKEKTSRQATFIIQNNKDEESTLRAEIVDSNAFTDASTTSYYHTSIAAHKEYQLANLPARTVEFEKIEGKHPLLGGKLTYEVVTEVLTGSHVFRLTMTINYIFNAVDQTQLEGYFKDYSQILNSLIINDR